MPPSPLQIKVKALERLLKEKSLYSREAEEEFSRLEDMKLANADAYAIKKQDEMLRETQRMIPEVEAKIADYKQKLSDYLLNYVGEESLDAAKDILNRC